MRPNNPRGIYQKKKKRFHNIDNEKYKPKKWSKKIKLFLLKSKRREGEEKKIKFIKLFY